MTRNRRLVLIGLIALVLGGAIIAGFYLAPGAKPGCTAEGIQPPTGASSENFLIVASSTGFNDSADHGVPATCWPVIHVSKGTMVNITVYNSDTQVHGFQVAHYLASPTEAIAPGQRVSFSFLADEAGTFQIYCAIPCSIHWAMISGELVVT